MKIAHTMRFSLFQGSGVGSLSGSPPETPIADVVHSFEINGGLKYDDQESV